MADELLPNEETEYPAEEEYTGGIGLSDSGEESYRSRKCCRCLSHRAGALAIAAFVSVANILTITVCMFLLFDDDIKVSGFNEEFNYVFMTTINAIMLISNFLIVIGVVYQQQKCVIAWLLAYAVLAFLENVVGFTAFILSMVTHVSAWAVTPFVLLLMLDGAYVYCIVKAHHYCTSMDGYTVFP